MYPTFEATLEPHSTPAVPNAADRGQTGSSYTAVGLSLPPVLQHFSKHLIKLKTHKESFVSHFDPRSIQLYLYGLLWVTFKPLSLLTLVKSAAIYWYYE